MANSTTLTIRLSPELKDKLDRIAIETRRSKSFLAAEALEDYATRELRIIEGIRRGMADAEAGRTVPHAQVMAEVDAIIEAAIARKAAKSA